MCDVEMNETIVRVCVENLLVRGELHVRVVAVDGRVTSVIAVRRGGVCVCHVRVWVM